MTALHASVRHEGGWHCQHVCLTQVSLFNCCKQMQQGAALLAAPHHTSAAAPCDAQLKLMSHTCPLHWNCHWQQVSRFNVLQANGNYSTKELPFWVPETPATSHPLLNYSLIDMHVSPPTGREENDTHHAPLSLLAKPLWARTRTGSTGTGRTEFICKGMLQPRMQ